MKKLSKILILLLMVFIPFTVKADMGAPERNEYEVIVTNPNGIKNYYLDNNSIIPYNTIIKIQYEYKEDNELYLESFGDQQIIVKASDVSLYSTKVVEAEEFSENDEVNTYYTYADGGYLYKGPSIMYEKVSEETIPKGTYLKEIGKSVDDCFSYVEYNGQKGWIYVYPYIDKQFLLYDEPTKFAKVVEADSNLVYAESKIKQFKDIKLEEYEEVNVTIGDSVSYDVYLMASPKTVLYGKIVNNEVRWMLDYRMATNDDGSNGSYTNLLYKNSISIYTLEEITYYSDLRATQKAGTIKSNEMVDIYANEEIEGTVFMGSIMFKKDGKFYFIHGTFDNPIKGIVVDNDNCRYITIIKKDGIPYYSDFNLKNKAGTLENLSSYRVLGIEYEDDTYLLSINGKKYFAAINYDKDGASFHTHGYEIKEIEYNKDIVIYTDIENLENGISSLKETVTVPKGDKVIYLGLHYENGKYYYIVKYNDVIGLVVEDSSSVTNKKEVDICPFTGEKIKENKSNNENKEEPKEENIEEKTLDSKTIIIIAVIVGVTIAVTAVVIIVLVNKKKKAVIQTKPESIMTANDLNIVNNSMNESETNNETNSTEEK